MKNHYLYGLLHRASLKHNEGPFRGALAELGLSGEISQGGLTGMLFKEKEMGPNVISFSRSVHRKRRMGHDCCKTGIQAKTSSVWLSTKQGSRQQSSQASGWTPGGEAAW